MLAGLVVTPWALIGSGGLSSHDYADDDERDTDNCPRGHDSSDDQYRCHRRAPKHNGHRCSASGAGARRKSIHARLRHNEGSKRRLSDRNPRVCAASRYGIRNLDFLAGYHAPHLILGERPSRLPGGICHIPSRAWRRADVNCFASCRNCYRLRRLIPTAGAESGTLSYVGSTIRTETHYAPRMNIRMAIILKRNDKSTSLELRSPLFPEPQEGRRSRETR